MRKSTLIFLIASLLSFVFYLNYLEPTIEQTWHEVLIFTLFIMFFRFLKRKAELYFEGLNNRLDKQLSVWIVIGLFSFLFIMEMLS